jgi:ribose/xylose/arabinose/galactoside ABC-type transport system permease subunit
MRWLSSWEKYVKKYVWDEDRTPFLISIDRLNRGQADKEIFIFVVFLGIPFALIALAATAQIVKAGIWLYLGLVIYAATILAAVVVLNANKNWLAALYCITAPLVILLFFVANGFSPNQGLVDHTIILILLVSWMRYTVRVVQMAKAYANLPEPPPPAPPELPTFNEPD